MAHASGEPIRIRMWWAQAYVAAGGDRDVAFQVLRRRLPDHRTMATLHALLGRLEYQRGRPDVAWSHLFRAMRADEPLTVQDLRCTYLAGVAVGAPRGELALVRSRLPAPTRLFIGRSRRLTGSIALATLLALGALGLGVSSTGPALGVASLVVAPAAVLVGLSDPSHLRWLRGLATAALLYGLVVAFHHVRLGAVLVTAGVMLGGLIATSPWRLRMRVPLTLRIAGALGAVLYPLTFLVPWCQRSVGSHRVSESLYGGACRQHSALGVAALLLPLALFLTPLCINTKVVSIGRRTAAASGTAVAAAFAVVAIASTGTPASPLSAVARATAWQPVVITTAFVAAAAAAAAFAWPVARWQRVGHSPPLRVPDLVAAGRSG